MPVKETSIILTGLSKKSSLFLDKKQRIIYATFGTTNKKDMANTRSVRDNIRTAVTQRTARLERGAAESAITALDEFDITREDATPERVREVHTQRLADSSQKLQLAKEQINQMREDLRAMSIGLEERLNEIGYKVSEAYQFQGWEKFLNFFGAKQKAVDIRYVRLQTQEVDQLVAEIKKLTQETINELGEREGEFEEAATEYRQTKGQVIEKYKQAQPRYKAAKGERENLDAEIKEREVDLESGVVLEDERPQREKDLEEVRRLRHRKFLEETDFLGVVTNAQRSIPILEQNTKAAEESIVAIHMMRRDALENTQNFTTLLDNAMVAVRNRATLERYESTDPAFKKTVTLVTQTNVNMAGAALQVAKQRVARAAIDPERSQQLMNELMGHIQEFLDGVIILEEEAKEGGQRAPVGPKDPPVSL